MKKMCLQLTYVVIYSVLTAGKFATENVKID